MRPRQIRCIFFAELFRFIRLIWPILSGVIFAMVGPGLLIGHIEGWRIVAGIMLTGLVAAVTVQALQVTAHKSTD